MMIVLVTICCRFGSRGLVKNLNVCSDFEQKVWSRFWSWSSGKIWSWSLVSSFLLMFCRMLNPRWILVWSLFCCWCFMWLWNSILVKILKLGLVKILKIKFYGEADVWLRFWKWCLVEILKMKFDQYYCLNSTLGSVVPLAMFGIFNMQWIILFDTFLLLATAFSENRIIRLSILTYRVCAKRVSCLL